MKKVLVLVAADKTNKEIAAAIGKSPRAVKQSLTRAFIRLGVHNRSAAVAAAIREGIITVPQK